MEKKQSNKQKSETKRQVLQSEQRVNNSEEYYGSRTCKDSRVQRAKL